MESSARRWLETQVRCVCATPPHRSADPVRGILRGPYRRLVERGERLAPSVAIDLALLFQHGTSVRFQVPPGLKEMDGRFLAPYCASLNAQAAALPLHRTVTRLDWLRHHGLGGGAGGERDAGTLLQMAAAALPALDPVPAPSALVEVLADLDARSVEAWLAGGSREKTEKTTNTSLLTFFRHLSPQALQDVMDDAGALLVEAAATVSHGAEGIDLPLLATCMNYHPLEDADPESTRKLLERIRPLERRPARSPEVGNHGLTNKGNLSAVLPSYLARPDFEERFLRKELFYFDRRARTQEPRRALVAWIIDRSAAMRLRAQAGWPRRDSLALRLGALVLEDALRRLAPLPAVELQTALIVHDGGQGPALQGRLILPRDFEVAHVRRGQNVGGVHLLRLPSAFPHCFLREPQWPEERLFANTNPSSSAVERSLELLYAVLSLGIDPDRDAPRGTLFDVLQITAAFPMEGDDRDLGEQRTPPVLHALGTSAALNNVVFDDAGVHWRSPRPAPGQAEATVPRIGSSAARVLEQVRSASWGDLLQRMAA